MSNEIATHDHETNALEASALASEQRRREANGKGVLEFLDNYATSWGKAAAIAEDLARTDYAGQFKGKPADLAAAILEAATLGIPPQQVGASIYVVHGVPALYGETALAIALDAGYTVDKTVYTPQQVSILVTGPDGREYPVDYTFDRAEREGLVNGNKVQYTKRPEKMLFWKCVGEASDQFFPHLLKGFRIKEDIEQSNPADFKRPVRATARRTDQPSVGDVRAQLTARATAPEPVEVGEVDELSNILARIETAADMEELSEIMGGAKTLLGEEEYDTARQIANAKAGEING